MLQLMSVPKCPVFHTRRVPDERRHAVLHEHDGIGIVLRPSPVGDFDSDAAMAHLVQKICYSFFRLVVQARRGFVNEHNLGARYLLVQDCARNLEQLLLAVGKVHVAHPGTQSSSGRDNVPQADAAQDALLHPVCHDVVGGSQGWVERVQVKPHGASEVHATLGDDGHSRAQDIRRDGANLPVIDADGAPVTKKIENAQMD